MSDTDRSASASLRGYCYQFDKTILEILKAGPADFVTVEYVEDVGVHSADFDNAIQCKYIPSRKYTDGAVRDALSKMLADSCVPRWSPVRASYVLYAHFKEGNDMPTAIGREELKRILTHQKAGERIAFHEANNISDGEIDDFVGRLTLVQGQDFDAQQQEVFRTMESVLSCSRAEAESFFYSNALRAVVDIARNPDPTARHVCPPEFIHRQIVTRTSLFNRWHVLLKGRESYRKMVRDSIRSRKIIHPQKLTGVFLGRPHTATARDSLATAAVIRDLASQYYPLGTVYYNVVPLAVILEGGPDDVIVVKRELLRMGVWFNDGFEHVSFTPGAWASPPIINRRAYGNKRAGDEVVRASYVIRVLSGETFRSHFADLPVPETAIFFAEGDSSVYFASPGTFVVSVAAHDIDDVAAILRK